MRDYPLVQKNPLKGADDMKKRKQAKSQVRFAALVVAAILALYTNVNDTLGTAFATSALQNKQTNDGSAIRLIVRSSKLVYRVGDPVEVSVLLENLTEDKIYLVGRAIYQGDIPTPLHYVTFALSDERGRPLRVFDGASVQDPIEKYGPDRKLISEKPATMAELMTREYIQLGPGSVYGFQTKLYKPGSVPGRYSLSATYHESEGPVRTALELRALPFPIWTERITSNTIEIKVIP